MEDMIRSTWCLDFTEESLIDVREELAAREALHRELWEDINSRVNRLRDIAQALPPDVLKEVNALYDNCFILNHEARNYGYSQMYQHMVSEYMRHFPYILHRMIKANGIERTNEKIQSSREWAIFQLLQAERRIGETKTRLAKKYGMNKSYWSRVVNYRISKFFIEMAKRQAKGEESASQDEDMLAKDPGPDVPQVTDKSKARFQELHERSEDWKIAIKLASEGETAKAFEFLKMSGFTDTEITKFQNEHNLGSE